MEEPIPAPDKQQIAALFPAAVSWSFSNCPSDAGPLLGAEVEASAGMSAIRLRSFRHGRHCARLALQSLGAGELAIARHKDRAPIWPAGLIGSIAHCEQVALAAAARQTDLLGLGLDVESRGDLEAAVEALICQPQELSMLARLGQAELDSRLLFSAKEAVYKCLWPTVRRYIDFLDVGLQLNSESRSFCIASATNLPMDLSGRLRGRYLVSEDLIFTCAYLESSARSG